MAMTGKIVPFVPPSVGKCDACGQRIVSRATVVVVNRGGAQVLVHIVCPPKAKRDAKRRRRR